MLYPNKFAPSGPRTYFGNREQVRAARRHAAPAELASTIKLPLPKVETFTTIIVLSLAAQLCRLPQLRHPRASCCSDKERESARTML